AAQYFSMQDELGWGKNVHRKNIADLHERGFDVLALDNRGTGFSDGISWTSYGEDVFDVLDQLEAGEISVPNPNFDGGPSELVLTMRSVDPNGVVSVGAEAAGLLGSDTAKSKVVVMEGTSLGAILMENTMALRFHPDSDERYKGYDIRGLATNIGPGGTLANTGDLTMVMIEGHMRHLGLGLEGLAPGPDVHESIPFWPGYYQLKYSQDIFTPDGGVDAYNRTRGRKGIEMAEGTHFFPATNPQVWANMLNWMEEVATEDVTMDNDEKIELAELACVAFPASGIKSRGVAPVVNVEPVGSAVADTPMPGMDGLLCTQDAVNVFNAANSGVERVILNEGTFHFGDDSTGSNRCTVLLTKGVIIQGDPDATLGTVIKGGGMQMVTGLGYLEAGAFRVVNGDGKSAEFANLWFRDFKHVAILAEQNNGLRVVNSKFTNPVASSLVPLPGAPEGARSVYGILVLGPASTGDLAVKGNIAEFGEYSGPEAHDEQFIAAILTSHENIAIVDNTIQGNDDGIEILFNGFYVAYDPSFESNIEVNNNSIDVTQVLDTTKWPAKVGIVVVGNKSVKQSSITDNTLSIKGNSAFYGEVADVSVGLVISGENHNVRANKVSMLPIDSAMLPAYSGIMMGLDQEFMPGIHFGPSVTNSSFKGNEISGVAVSGIMASHFNGRNESHNNVFSGDNFDNLTVPSIPPFNPIGGNVVLGSSTYDNVFKGNYEPILDMAPPGANTY
ncbi:hypothetical protein ACFL26_01210, partial [Patescibacteria group bacterium]